MERQRMGSDLMMQDIPPPPPGFRIVGGGAPVPPPAPAPRPAAPARPSQPRGLRNNNPGNIEDGAFARSLPGYAGSDGRFARFENASAGAEAAPRLLRSYLERGFDTPAAIINRWAPPSDNNPTAQYAAYVAQRVGVDVNDRITPDQVPLVAQAIAEFENGQTVRGAPAAQASAPPPPPPGFQVVPNAAAPAAQQPASPLDDLNIHRPEMVDMDAAAALGQRAKAYTGPGSSEDNPFILRENDNSPEYRDALQSLSRGMYVQTPEGVRRLSGDPYVNANVDPNDARVGQAVLREENLADQSRAFAMGAAEQIPFLDEAAVGAAGLLSGRGYSDVRDSYRAVQDIDNQVNRDQRVAGGITGAGAMMLAPGVGRAGSFIRAGATPLVQTARAAAVGAGSGALFGAANTDGGLEDRAMGGLLGAGVGAATGGILDAGGQSAINAAQRRFAAGPSPARQLSRQGVDLTPGQAAGGVMRRVEDGLTSVPILGDAIRGAQRRGLSTFDRAATNTALEPIGVNLADTAGREGVRAADDAISAAYTRALEGTTVGLDDAATAALAQARRGERLTPDLRRNLNAVLDNALSRFEGGPVAGDVWKQVDSELAAAVRAADRGASSAPEQRILRDRLDEARKAVGGAMERANPEAYAAVRAADRASAQYRLVRKATADVASAGRGGDASPATLNRAVIAAGGERQAARGESLLQDLTDNAMQVMPSTVPDSGTALRGLLSLGGLGGGATAIGANPAVVGGSIGLLGLASTLYGPTGQKIFNAIYRSTDRQSANSALGELARMAAQNPALQSQYEAAARHVLETFGSPSPQPAPQAARQPLPTSR